MEPYSVALAVVAIALATYYYCTRGYTFFKDHGIPYQTPIPLLGNSWPPLVRYRSFAEWVQDLYNFCPEAKYTGMYDLMTPVYMIRDPELIKSVTVKNFENFVDHRGFVDEVADPLFGKNLFSLRGERWKEIRATLSPAFTSSKMKAMFKLMSECAAYYGNYFVTLSEGETEVDVKDAFTRYTNDVIATCAFGIRVDSMHDRNNKFFVYGREATIFGTVASIKFFLIRSMPRLGRYLGLRLIRKEIAEFFEDLVKTTIDTRDEKGIIRPDMLQLMMETRGKMGPGRELTIEDMTAQAFVFFFGGFESTSTTMCFAVHEIAMNPEVQERLHEEIDQVLEDGNGDVTYEQINDMKYLDAVINETLRLYPIAVAADRVCVKDFELPPTLPGTKPHMLKAGESIWISLYGMQRDEKYFEEPTKFNPDRFYDDPKKYANAGVYIPFGIGPRMCIGNRFALLEIKALIFHLLARCELKPCSKTCVPMKLSKKGFSMRPENGFWLKFEQRKNVHPSLAPKVANGTSAH